MRRNKNNSSHNKGAVLLQPLIQSKYIQPKNRPDKVGAVKLILFSNYENFNTLSGSSVWSAETVNKIVISAGICL